MTDPDALKAIEGIMAAPDPQWGSRFGCRLWGIIHALHAKGYCDKDLEQNIVAIGALAVGTLPVAEAVDRLERKFKARRLEKVQDTSGRNQIECGLLARGWTRDMLNAYAGPIETAALNLDQENLTCTFSSAKRINL